MDKIILLLLITYAMGFIAAIPVGAIDIEIARRSLNNYPSSAILIVVGSTISDALYGVIALFGIAPFLQYPSVVAIFEFVNALILIFLGIWSIRESKRSILENKKVGSILNNRKVSLITGFTLAITNPVMVFWWLLGARFLSDIGIVEKFSVPYSILFLFAGTIGISSYLTLLVYAVYKAKRFFSDQIIRRVTIAFGMILILLAGYFVFHSLSIIL